MQMATLFLSFAEQLFSTQCCLRPTWCAYLTH